MDEKLSKSSVEQIDALSEKISTDCQADKELRRELHGHIEDLVLGYVTGKRRITEEDALLLAEQHFGDSEKLRGALIHAHGGRAYGFFLRRLGAFVTAYLVSWLALRVMHSSWAIMSRMILWNNPSAVWRACSAFGLAEYPIVFAIMMLLLRRWKNAERQHKPIWFNSISAIPFLVGLILLLVICYCATIVYCSLPAESEMQRAKIFLSVPFIRLAFIVTTAFVAAWWCNLQAPPKPTKAFFSSALVMALTMSLLLALVNWMGSPVAAASPTYHGSFNSDLICVSPLMMGSLWWWPFMASFPDIVVTVLFAAAAYTLFAKERSD